MLTYMRKLEWKKQIGYEDLENPYISDTCAQVTFKLATSILLGKQDVRVLLENV